MRRKVGSRLVLAALLPVLSALPALAQDTSNNLLPPSVDQYAFAHPYLYYAVPARCTTQFGGTPADYQASLRTGPIVNELEPVQIILHDMVTGARRLLWEYSPPRGPGQCNPYRVVSNLVFDAQYVYWVDNQFGIQRLPRSASAGDASELLTDDFLGTPNADSQIVDGGDRLYVYGATSFDSGVVFSVEKNSGLLSVIDWVAKPPARLQFDGRFLYYLSRTGLSPTRGTLRRWDSWSGQTVDAATDVTAFTSVSWRLVCNPRFGCGEVSLVLIASGRRVFLRDTGGGGSDVDQYVSAHPNAVVYAMALDSAANRLYLFEERPPLTQPSFTNDQVLVRAPVLSASGEPAVLLVRNGDPLDGLATESDVADVYWRHRFERTIEMAPKNLAPVPQAELAITGIEVTQEIQDLANSVRLVAGKRTFVRVHARSTGSASVPGIEAVLSGSRSGVSLGEIRPINPTGATLTLRSAPRRQNLNDSFLFELPADWTAAGPLRLDALINGDDRPIEINRDDNEMTRIVGFSDAHTLVVQLVEFNWALGTTIYRVSDTNVSDTLSFTQAIYPVAGVGPYHDALLDSGLLLVTRRTLFDGEMDTRVNRSAAECGTDNPATPGDDRNTCAANRSNAFLREMKTKGELDPRYFAYGLLPSDPSNMALFPRGWAAGGVGSGPAWDPDYMAHEVGHLLGRGHPATGNGCGHSADDGGYPYPDTQLRPAGADPETSFEGFDQRSAMPFLNGRDIMGYCTPEWISNYTFEALYQAIASGLSGGGGGGPQPLRASGPVTGDWLIVIGDIDGTDGNVTLHRVRRVSAAEPALSDMGPYRLELRGAAGALLDSWRFDARPIDDASTPRASFDLVVPFAAGTRSLQIVEVASGGVLASRPVSANAPAVSNVALAGAPAPVSGVVNVTFAASDADGAALRFDLLFSSDGGNTWRTLVADAQKSPIAVDTAELPGGSGRFRVQASDGVLTGFADSAPFTVASKPPRVQIVAPEDGTRVRYDQIVNLIGVASDPQDGALIDATALVWSDDRGNVLGSGARVVVGSLALGTRTITLTATNSLGLSASDSVALVVEEQVGVPGPTLAVDPRELTIQVTDPTAGAQHAALSITNAGAGELTWSASADRSWIGLGATSGEAPGTLELSLSHADLPDDALYEGTVTIASTSPPGQSAAVRLRLVKGTPFDGGGPVPEPSADWLGLGAASALYVCARRRRQTS